MAKSSRKIVLAVLTILLCIALLIGGTYALFSASMPVSNHLIAGNLNATLVRTNLTRIVLGEDGHLHNDPDPKEKDFSATSNDNLFGLKDGMKIAPGCSFTADMKLTNNGTVAFVYWIEIKLKAESPSNKLSDQLQVTVTQNGAKTEKPLSEGLAIGSQKDPIGIVELTKSVQFTVSVEFSDRADNNDAKEQEAQFDLVVHAVQYAQVA